MEHNFYINEAGIYEGRGFRRTGLDGSFSIDLLGCFKEPNKEVIDQVLDQAVRLGVLAPNYPWSLGTEYLCITDAVA